jgi:hypothetical protein
MSTFKGRWEKILKHPGRFSLTDLDELLNDATADEALLVIEQSVAWFRAVMQVPGGQNLHNDWVWFLSRAYARLRATARDAGDRRRLLKRALAYAEAMDGPSTSTGPKMLVLRIQEEIAQTLQ